MFTMPLNSMHVVQYDIAVTAEYVELFNQRICTFVSLKQYAEAVLVVQVVVVNLTRG